jgi:hypothetical protein
LVFGDLPSNQSLARAHPLASPPILSRLLRCAGFGGALPAMTAVPSDPIGGFLYRAAPDFCDRVDSRRLFRCCCG